VQPCTSTEALYRPYGPKGSRCIALLFLDHSTRRRWSVSVTPRPLFTSGRDPVPIVQESGWAPGPVWTGAENLAPTGNRSPDRPASSQSLFRLRYPAQSICNVESKGSMSIRICLCRHQTTGSFRYKVLYFVMLLYQLFSQKVDMNTSVIWLGSEIQLFELARSALPLPLDFWLWGLMWRDGDVRKVDTQDELLACILDAASGINKCEDQLCCLCCILNLSATNSYKINQVWLKLSPFIQGVS